VVGILACAACGETKFCTLVGCTSGMTVRIASRDGSWPAGDYSIEITFDGRVQTCELPTEIGRPERCTPSLWLTLESEHGCSGCEHLAIESTETPLTRDGTEILRDASDLTYAVNTPNGPGCPPVCRRASVEYTTTGN
jgi:hypothetical protein